MSGNRQCSFVTLELIAVYSTITLQIIIIRLVEFSVEDDGSLYNIIIEPDYMPDSLCRQLYTCMLQLSKSLWIPEQRK